MLVNRFLLSSSDSLYFDDYIILFIVYMTYLHCISGESSSSARKEKEIDAIAL
jgi:hypothetical protein